MMTTRITAHTVSTRLPTNEGQFQLAHYQSHDGKEHLALIMGEVREQREVLVRVHSECFTGDVLGSLRCDCGEQLQQAMRQIADEGRGVIVYLRQEGRGIGLQQKLAAYNLQDQGYDTVDANLLLGHGADERTYEAAVDILTALGVESLRLLTNNPNKIEQLRNAGLQVVERVPLMPTVHTENRGYLTTKVARMRHLLQLPTDIAIYQNGSNSSNGDHGNNGLSSQNGHNIPTHAVGKLPKAALSIVDGLREQTELFTQENRRPFVTLSYAQSLDGSIASIDHRPLRISCDQSMLLTHHLRAAHEVILVGVGTILADDPRLTVRLTTGADPQPIVLDSQLRTPPTARCLTNQRPPWIITTSAALASAQADKLRAAGATLYAVPANADGQICLEGLLALLHDLGIGSVMVEGGASILTSFFTSGLAQAAVITVAPIFVGGLPAFQPSSTALATAQRPVLSALQVLQLGADMIYYGHLTTT